MSHSSHKIRRLSSWGLPQPSHTVQSRQRQPFCSIVFDIWPHTQHNTHTNLFDRNPFTHYNSRLVTKDRIAHAYPQQIWWRISTVDCISKYDHLKIATLLGHTCSHLIYGSLGPPESIPQMAPELAQRFMKGSQLWPKETLTETPVATGTSNTGA